MRTIAAISTPPGKGGIAVVRVSGDTAVQTVRRIFLPKSGASLSIIEHGRAVYGSVIGSNGALIDDGMATVFYAPRSYTGEDTVEISCHGGVLLARRVLETIIEAGAVPAASGEFTRRAFLNGKLSLTQAEAVAELLDAHSDTAIAVAYRNLRGGLSRETERIGNELLSILTDCAVSFDYPDEQLSLMTISMIAGKLSDCEHSLRRLLSTFKAGAAVTSGIKTVIVGAPNVGKSSLLNALAGYSRAIVSDIAGTTRDTIEETASCGNALLRLVDTAGLRDGIDPIEREGVERTLRAAAEAELLLAVFDAGVAPTFEISLPSVKVPKIAVVNKCDLFSGKRRPEAVGFDAVVYTSTKTGEGIELLRATVERIFHADRIDGNDAIITSARVFAALSTAHEAVETAVTSCDAALPLDIIALDIARAVASVNESDGRAVGEATVNEIFSRFCVGK